MYKNIDKNYKPISEYGSKSYERKLDKIVELSKDPNFFEKCDHFNLRAVLEPLIEGFINVLKNPQLICDAGNNFIEKYGSSRFKQKSAHSLDKTQEKFTQNYESYKSYNDQDIDYNEPLAHDSDTTSIYE